MRSHVVRSTRSAALMLALGCSQGDLTLPGSIEPATLVVISGDGQRAEAGTYLDEPLTIQVRDALARGMAGTPVRFGFVGDLPGAEVDPATVLTDADGRASALVRLGEVAGDQVVVAEVTNTLSSDLRARFHVTAEPPDNDDDDDDDGEDGKKGKGKGNND